MSRKTINLFTLFISVFILISLACTGSQSNLTSTPQPTSTIIATSTNTPRPSPTPRPTFTPDIAATQHVNDLFAEVQNYYDKGYLTTTEGRIVEFGDFSYDWAQLGSYKLVRLQRTASDFVLSAHFKWNAALKNSGTAGCGFVFGLQPNDDHYAVFLDRSKIYFRIRNLELGYSTSVEPTRVRGKVKFDYPAEADFALIVQNGHAYVLVNGQVVSEYSLLEGRPLQGDLGLAVLSGTNKDFGTHCEISHLHLWTPGE